MRKFLKGLQRWQSLTSGLLAIAAAAWAWQYTQRQIDIAREQLAAATVQAESAQRQLVLAAGQAENAQQQLALMEMDQRPYVWPNSKDNPALDSGTRIFWNWQYKNIGKSAAHDIKWETFIKLGTGPFRRNDLTPVGTFDILPAGIDLWATVYSPVGQTQRDFDRWLRSDLGIQIIIKIGYSDSRGKRYSVARCFGMLGNGNLATCDAGVVP